MDGERNRTPIEVVLALYAAIRDRQIDEMRAVLDPEVVCYPLVRPGQSVYYGHDSMIKLVDYMHGLHGNYQIEVEKITEEPASRGAVRVRAQVRIVPEPGPGRPASVLVNSEYTVQNGLINWIVSKPGSAVPLRNS